MTRLKTILYDKVTERTDSKVINWIKNETYLILPCHCAPIHAFLIR
jgi:hypothetical protein